MRVAPVPFLVFLALQLGPTESTAQPRRLVPVGNYHAHLMSESAVTGSLTDLTSNPVRDVANVTFTLRRGGSGRWLIGTFLRENRSTSTGASAFTADQLIEQLDSAGIKHAIVYSEAYWFGSSLMPGADRDLALADEYAKVRAENDWVANQHRLPIVVPMRPRRRPYGRENVEVMLREVLPQAPDVPIQIAHLAGWGGYDEATDQAAEAFADAVARRDPASIGWSIS